MVLIEKVNSSESQMSPLLQMVLRWFMFIRDGITRISSAPTAASLMRRRKCNHHRRRRRRRRKPRRRKTTMMTTTVVAAALQSTLTTMFPDRACADSVAVMGREARPPVHWLDCSFNMYSFDKVDERAHAWRVQFPLFIHKSRSHLTYSGFLK